MKPWRIGFLRQKPSQKKQSFAGFNGWVRQENKDGNDTKIMEHYERGVKAKERVCRAEGLCMEHRECGEERWSNRGYGDP